MTNLFSKAPPPPPPVPVPIPPPTMPDPMGPASREAALKAGQDAALRAGRSSTILTTAQNRGVAPGAPYGNRTLGGGS